MPKRTKKLKAERPAAAIPSPGSFRVEVRPTVGGKKRVLVCACDEICAYSREEVRFRHGGEIVIITGDALWCRTFACRTAEVIGRVHEIIFSSRDGKR